VALEGLGTERQARACAGWLHRDFDTWLALLHRWLPLDLGHKAHRVTAAWAGFPPLRGV
jgi:hypothetical protein